MLILMFSFLFINCSSWNIWRRCFVSFDLKSDVQFNCVSKMSGFNILKRTRRSLFQLGNHDNTSSIFGLSVNVDKVIQKRNIYHEFVGKCVQGFPLKKHRKEFCFLIAKHCDIDIYKEICARILALSFPATRVVRDFKCTFPCNWMLTTNSAVVRVCRFYERTRQYCEDYDIYEIRQEEKKKTSIEINRK